MSRPPSTRPATDEAQVRPFYARVLRLRQLQPSGVVCFILLEGSVGAALVLALAELVGWWGVIVLPVAVALLVKANDMIAGRMSRSADRVVRRERERFQREAGPAVGRATVPVDSVRYGQTAPGLMDRRGTVYASRGRADDHEERGGTDRMAQGGEQPGRNGGHSEWPGRRAVSNGQQPVSNGQQPGWNGQQPEWPGQQWGRPGVRTGWSSGQDRYG